VVIGSGAKVLGPFTVGDNSRIGSGSVVVKAVPPNSVVVGIPGRITHRDGKRVEHGVDLNMTDLPDPVAKALQFLTHRLAELERAIEELRRLRPSAPHAQAGGPDDATRAADDAPGKHAPGKVRGAVRRGSQE